MKTSIRWEWKKGEKIIIKKNVKHLYCSDGWVASHKIGANRLMKMFTNIPRPEIHPGDGQIAETHTHKHTGKYVESESVANQRHAQLAH